MPPRRSVEASSSKRAEEREGNNLKGFKDFGLKMLNPRPKPGLDCLIDSNPDR